MSVVVDNVLRVFTVFRTLLSMTDQRKWRIIDRQTALSIASSAGCKTHDGLGNILQTIWCCYSAQRTLLTFEDLRKLLLEQVRDNFDHKKPQIRELDSSKPLVKWIVHNSKQWEAEFALSTQESYDIGEFVFSIMLETIFQLEPFFEDGLKALELRIADVINRTPDGTTPAVKFFCTPRNCMVRMLFRDNTLNPILVRFAGKLLQQREICAKPGVYSATKQFNNIQQTVSEARYVCVKALQESEPSIDSMAKLNDRLITQHVTDETKEFSTSSV